MVGRLQPITRFNQQQPNEDRIDQRFYQAAPDSHSTKCPVIWLLARLGKRVKRPGALLPKGMNVTNQSPHSILTSSTKWLI
jgi:hypothetical protein